MNMVMNNKF